MISIIIPTYNERQTIGRTLGSLAAVRGDFEVFVVDGESEDGTLASIEAATPHFPRPLRLMTAERNRAVQLNRGAESACGDVLLFLHADALLPPEALEKLEIALRS